MTMKFVTILFIYLYFCVFPDKIKKDRENLSSLLVAIVGNISEKEGENDSKLRYMSLSYSAGKSIPVYKICDKLLPKNFKNLTGKPKMVFVLDPKEVSADCGRVRCYHNEFESVKTMMVL